MAKHDFIDQAAAALKAGHDTAEIIARGIWSGLDIETIDGLLMIAAEIAAD